VKEGLYFYNYDSVVDWLNGLKLGAVNEDELAFIQLLLDSFKKDAKERPYAGDLAKQIQAICKQQPYKYIGECCVLNNTVNTSSTLKQAVDAASVALPSPKDLEKGSLLHFVASTALSLSNGNIQEACPSLDALYEQVSNRTICSIRSAERKFLLIIAPVSLPFYSSPTILLTHPLEILQRWQNLSLSLQWLY
jgi:hypothetical protein